MLGLKQTITDIKGRTFVVVVNCDHVILYWTRRIQPDHHLYPLDVYNNSNPATDPCVLNMQSISISGPNSPPEIIQLG